MNNNEQTASSRKTLYTLGFVFIIVSTVIWGWTIIGLAWMIPMIIFSSKAMNEVGTPNEKKHLGLGIIALIFGTLLGGIFILIASSEFDDTNMYNQSFYNGYQNFNPNNDNGFNNDQNNNGPFTPTR